MKTIFIGVDGGGTKTRALASDAAGTPMGRALTGASNPNSVGAGTALENLISAILNALADANVPAGTPVVAFCGVSGVNDSQTAREMEAKLLADGRINFQKLRVENDTRSLQASAFGLDSGIVLIAGTGSKCYGRSRDGREWETGGYDFHVSDEGSAFAIARAGLTAAVRGADGRGNATTLTGTLFDALKIREVGQISQRLHQDSLKNPGKPMTKDEIAALAIFVDKAALAGDAVAGTVLREQMGELVKMVATVAQKIGVAGTPIRVGVTGGVITHEPCATIFREQLREVLPLAEVFEPQVEPVVGANLLARERVGKV